LWVRVVGLEKHHKDSPVSPPKQQGRQFGRSIVRRPEDKETICVLTYSRIYNPSTARRPAVRPEDFVAHVHR